MLADTVLVLHACFVGFVVVGQLLILLGWWRGWRWSRQPLFRIVHLAAIVMVVLESWFGVPCPLTVLENHLRIRGGGDAYPAGFIAGWLSRLLFYDAPGWVFAVVYTAFGALVMVSFLVYPPRFGASRR